MQEAPTQIKDQIEYSSSLMVHLRGSTPKDHVDLLNSLRQAGLRLVPDTEHITQEAYEFGKSQSQR